VWWSNKKIGLKSQSQFYFEAKVEGEVRIFDFDNNKKNNQTKVVVRGPDNFDRKKPHPPRGVAYLLCSLIKNRE